MTLNKRVVLLIISIFSAITLGYAIKLVVVYYYLADVINSESLHYLELSQKELMTMSKQQLADALLSYMELSKDKNTASSIIPSTVFYVILSLIISLKLSLLYNWHLAKIHITRK